MICRARIHENVRHYADILVVVVMHGVTFLLENGHSVAVGRVFHHVQLGVLGVFGKVLYDLIIMRLIAEGELF